MSLNDLLNDANIVAVVCNQWGDTGKGKFSDYLSMHWADVCARGTGGNNAGHTVVVNGLEKIFHLIPSGISTGLITVLGNGMVIDLEVLCQEMDELVRDGVSLDKLMVSKDASVIMPYHVKRDREKNQSQKSGGVGSTGRGIGPCYEDKIARRGIMIGDLSNRAVLLRKIEKAAKFYPEQSINPEEVVNGLMPYAERVKNYVRNTVAQMHEFARSRKKILLEGAQGLLLSVEHGTYPYVTGSDCSLNGTASGVGLSAAAVDLGLGIVKYPFMTRVGGGPFPTEFGGRASEKYCAEDNHRKIDELRDNGISFTEVDGKVKYDVNDPKIMKMLNSSDQFIQGIGIRLKAGEYGATTGRPRRTGWTDAIAAKYAVGINGPLIILTKVDCLSYAEEFKICYGYRNGSSEIKEEFERHETFLRGVSPEYKTYRGYEDIGDVRKFDRLPIPLLESISDFERFTAGQVVAVSTGADREQTIFV